MTSCIFYDDCSSLSTRLHSESEMSTLFTFKTCKHKGKFTYFKALSSPLCQ